MTHEEPPIAIGEAAKRLGVSVDTLRRWSDKGLIRSSRSPSGQRRFPLSEIERLANYPWTGTE